MVPSARMKKSMLKVMVRDPDEDITV